MSRLDKVRGIVSRLSLSALGTKFTIIVESDKLHKGGRIYIQASYIGACNKTGEVQEWKGRKYYLSDFMTDDEIVKTCYTAFKQAVEHEVMEGFKVDGIVLFNPHINFEALLKISNQEITRK